MWGNELFLRRLGTLFFAITLLLIVYGGWRTLTSMSAFNFRQVQVTGQVEHVSPSMARAAIVTALNGNFFGQRLEEIQAAFEKLPWVQEAGVRRIWPDKLVIDIVEHTPYARWGNASLMDPQGELFQGATDEVLPILRGPDYTQHEVKRRYESFSKILVSANAFIAELELDNRYAWSMKLTSGEVIRLGKEDKKGVLKERVEQFAAVYPNLSNRYGQALASVDMRYVNGFAIKLKSADEKERVTAAAILNQQRNVSQDG